MVACGRRAGAAFGDLAAMRFSTTFGDSSDDDEGVVVEEGRRGAGAPCRGGARAGGV